MVELNEILGLLKSPSKKDIELITKAYSFAEKVHVGQKRLSGEPYFVHLFHTAKILAELGMGPTTIAAGLLHDTIEESKAKPEILEKEFGKEILFLINGVTKLGKLHYSGAERYTENLRKLFVAMSRDLRVLIIKFSDRLHNMRTLDFMDKDSQVRVAKETLEIYAPLAYRLGIRKINRELEDLAFPYVYPDEYEKVKKLLKQKHKETETHLERLRKSIVKGLSKAGITDFKTDYRLKGIYSLYKKLIRKNWEIENIYDISAVRVIVPTVEDCYRVLGVIHGIRRPLPGRIKDYIAFPKPNGYRALHTTIFAGDGSIFEIQIRTEEMHHEAEYGVASHFSYKENFDKDGANESTISWVKQFIPFFTWGENRGEERQTAINGDIPTWVKELAGYETVSDESKNFMTDIKTDFFQNRVFVFTPKGDVVDLPIDSNPIDFAYAIHSDIGDHIAGAKVNGKLVSLDTALVNGDIVEILVKENAKPSQKWVEIAKTAAAKKHIRSAIDKLEKK